MHAHVPALEARLVELQAELAPLLDRHQELAEALPWARQLVRIYACRVHGLTYIHAVSKACCFSCFMQSWKWPALTSQSAAAMPDRTPQHILVCMCFWWDRYHSLDRPVKEAACTCRMSCNVWLFSGSANVAKLAK